MKKKIKRLNKILKISGVPTERREKVLMYLSVCFLGFSGDEVAAYFKTSYSDVRNAITVYGLRLQKNKHFKKLLHQVTRQYSFKNELEFVG